MCCTFSKSRKHLNKNTNSPVFDSFWLLPSSFLTAIIFLFVFILLNLCFTVISFDSSSFSDRSHHCNSTSCSVSSDLQFALLSVKSVQAPPWYPTLLYTTECSLWWCWCMPPLSTVWLMDDADLSDPSAAVPLMFSCRWQHRICLKVALISLSR